VLNNNHPIHGQKGFTLIEIMIALVVFLIIMLGVAAGMIQSIRVNKANAVRDEAVRLATDELNALKALQFSLNGTAAGLNATAWAAQPTVLVNIRAGAIQYARSLQITDVAASATALKRVDVAIGWDDPGGGPAQAPTGSNRQVSFSTVLVRDDNLL
jgi:prepilin-type N-terminal cleavage/methylation domain-containing protein